MLIAIAVCVFASVVLIVVGLVGTADGVRRTLATEGGGNNVLADSPIGSLIGLGAAVNRRFGLHDAANHLHRMLIEAGQPGGAITGFEFLAAMELLGLTAFGGLIAFFILSGGLSLLTIFLSFAIAAFAVFFLYNWLDGEVSQRRRDISRQLPFFLDLAIMCMGSGASFQETLEIYANDNPDDAFAVELRIVLGEVRMGKTLQEAFESLLSRVDLEPLRNVINALINGQKMGTPISAVIREQAETMRFKRSQDAERMGEELKVRIQGPVMLMMIAVFILVLGPAIVELASSGIF